MLQWATALPESSSSCVFFVTCEGPFVKVSVGLLKVTKKKNKKKRKILLVEGVGVTCKLSSESYFTLMGPIDSNS